MTKNLPIARIADPVKISDEYDLTPQQAVALVYNEASGAPKIIGKGRGLMAEEIIKRAKENMVFVHESRELVSILMGLDMDKEIPESLYQSVAEILAWIYAIETEITLPNNSTQV